MKINLNLFKIFSIIFLLFISFYLEFVYKYFVVRLFAYQHFTYTFDLSRYIESKIYILIILLILFFVNISEFIFALSSLIIVILFIPNLVLFEFMPFERIIVISIMFFLLFVFLFSLNFKSKVSYRVTLPMINTDKRIYFLAFLIIVMIIPFIIIYGFKLNFKVFFLEEIYETRKVGLSEGNIYTNYAYSWLAKIMLPILFIFGFAKKKYNIVILALSCILYLFLIMAHKAVFFSIFLILLFYFFNNYYKKIFVFLSLIVLLFISLRLLSYFSDNIYLESIIIRRSFFIPAILNKCYFEFFKDNPLLLSHSIFSPFINYPYIQDPVFLISAVFFQDPKSAGNNGIISDGYMNFGLWGTFLFSILTALMIRFFDRLNINPKFFGIFFIFITTIVSSAFLTSLLTHGILLLLFLSLSFLKDSAYDL